MCSTDTKGSRTEGTKEGWILWEERQFEFISCHSLWQEFRAMILSACESQPLKPELRRGLDSRQCLVISEKRPLLTLSFYWTSSHWYSLGYTHVCLEKQQFGSSHTWAWHFFFSLTHHFSPNYHLDSSWAFHQRCLKFKVSFYSLSVQSFVIQALTQSNCLFQFTRTFSLTHFLQINKLTYLLSHTLISLGYVLYISPSTSSTLLSFQSSTCSHKGTMHLFFFFLWGASIVVLAHFFS